MENKKFPFLTFAFCINVNVENVEENTQIDLFFGVRQNLKKSNVHIFFKNIGFLKYIEKNLYSNWIFKQRINGTLVLSWLKCIQIPRKLYRSKKVNSYTSDLTVYRQFSWLKLQNLNV